MPQRSSRAAASDPKATSTGGAPLFAGCGVPSARQNLIVLCAIPRPWIRGAWIKVEWTKAVDDALWGNVGLRFTNAGLVTSYCQNILLSENSSEIGYWPAS